MPIQYRNKIELTKLVKNIAKHYPIINYIVPPYGKGVMDEYFEEFIPFQITEYYDYGISNKAKNNAAFDNVDVDEFPVVLDSYYHKIKSDGERILVIFKPSE
jgi:hypothetical protein